MKPAMDKGHAICSSGGLTFAMGLQWSVHDSLALARAHAAGSKHPSWVHAPLQVNRGQGATERTPPTAQSRSAAFPFALGVHSGRIRGTVLCAAMAVGLVKPDVVVCQRLSHDKVWLCVISGGLPFPDQDRIIDAALAPQALDEVMTYAHEIVGDVPSANASLSDVLSEFERRVRDRVIDRTQFRSIRLRRSPSRLRRWLLASLPVVVLAVAWIGWQGWQFISAREQGRQSSLAGLSQSREAAAVKAAARARLMQSWRESVARQHAELEVRPHALTTRWLQWNTVRRNLPLTLAGYQPESLNCDDKRCLATWVARSAWARLADRDLIPDLVAGSDGTETLQSQIALPAPVQAAATGGRVRAPEMLQQALASATQYIAPEIRMSPLQPVAVSAPAELGIAPEVVGAKGRLQLQLRGSMALLRANDVIGELAHWPVRLQSVSWGQVSSAQPSVDLQAEYLQPASATR